jgi:sortase (surface protein transpeptidase)
MPTAPAGPAPVTPAAPAAATGGRGTPVRIVIPAIGVDAAVVDLDRNPDGTLEVPGWDDAGWWRRGPEPGERGPAVIVGHVDSRAGPAVFYRLDELVAGDLIEIPLDGGGTSRYVVERSERFAKAAFPTRAVYQLTDGPELRLITCDGEFDESTGHYVDNLVVFARPA